MSLLHGLLNFSGFLLMLFAVVFARRHKMKLHHLFLFLSLLSITVSSAVFLIFVGGIINFHCVSGIVVYLLLIFAGISGFLFRSRKIKRQLHELFGVVGLTSFFLQVVYGFVKSLLQ